MWKAKTFPLAPSMGTNTSHASLGSSKGSPHTLLTGSMGDSSESNLEQRLLVLERILKDQQESHQQKLLFVLATNATLREENATLRNTAAPHRPGNQTAHRSPNRSESPENFSPPCHARISSSYLHNNKSPSSGRNLDPALHALDDMSPSPFVPAILSHDALPHFTMPEFQMYDGLQDPFDYLMHY